MNKLLSLVGFNGAVNLFYSIGILMFLLSFKGYKNYDLLDFIYVFIWFCFPHSRRSGITNNFKGINYRLNHILKNIIKQPRPTNMKFIHPSDLHSSKEYGMPSGHAQLTSSMMTFLILEFNNPYINAIAVLQLLLTVVQRYVYRMHSISQLIAGTIIGCLSGGIFYIAFNKISNRKCKSKCKSNCKSNCKSKCKIKNM